MGCVKKQVQYKYLRTYKAILMSVLPLLLCIITTMIDGHSIFDVYIPSSEWNDELFYFKQVESILEFGYPYGFFGFNESFARILSFAAWSPVLVLPWLLWGSIFGWNLMSPIYANIAFMMIAMFVFVWIVKPTWKQIVMLVMLYTTFTPFTRYMMSAMPECICFGMLIIFLACTIGYVEEEKKGYLVALLIISVILTLMRPYLVVFMILPIYYYIKIYKMVGGIISIGAFGITGGMYVWIKVFLGAEYFTPLYDTSWIKVFFSDGVVVGFENMIFKLYTMGWDFFGKCKQGFFEGLASGSFFIGFLVIFLILVLYVVYLVMKKEKKYSIVYAHLAFCFFAMWIALLLMYKMTEGSKHLLSFIAVGIFAVAVMKCKYVLHIIVPVGVFIYLFMIMAIDPYDYQVPYGNVEYILEMEKIKEDMAEKLSLDFKEVPTFENTIIWVFSDLVGERYELTDWQILYSLPKGFGISCSYAEYVIENFHELKSKYICIPSGSVIEQMCIEQNFTYITEGRNSVIYEMR